MGIYRALHRAPGSKKRPSSEAGVPAVRHKPMTLLTWVLISRAQEMWATELRPLMEHAIEPLMATRRATSASKVTPVAGPPSRQKGDGPWCRCSTAGWRCSLKPVTCPERNDPVCKTRKLRTASASLEESVHLHSALPRGVAIGRTRREQAFESALGLSNVRALAFDERTGSSADELRSHHHRRRR